MRAREYPAAFMSTSQESIPSQFIAFALRTGVLRFGEFRTKAGRLSPYFFNAGGFDHGGSLGQLAQFYARTLLAAESAGGAGFDMLFGPAYKGITLASATAVALAGLGRDLPFAFNRKEAKDHGEGGLIVGAPLVGRVVIVDDVITDGAAKRESVALIRAHGARPACVLIALDRMERAGTEGALSADSAVRTFERENGVPVHAIARFTDLMDFLDSDAPLAAPARPFRAAMQAYRDRYGVA
jgi:orotate phosphoribosyltransferase